MKIKRALFITVIALMMSNSGSAQGTALPKRDTAWKVHGFFGVTASRTELSNWQGGGQNNLSLNSIFDLEAIYKRDKYEQWTNKLDAQYGFIRQGFGRNLRKNMDQIFALSKYDTRAIGDWYYSSQLDFRSQFAPGYNYVGDTISGRAVSDLLSPGYVQLAIGLDYKPAEYFSLTFAPASGKVTIVGRQYLADQGAYGVDKATYDANGVLLSHGKHVRFEFGGRVIMKFKKDIMTNVNLDSYLDLFTNYMVHPGNIDVVFNNMLTFKINRYFTANVICQMIYDDDIVIRRDLNKDGNYDGPGEFAGPRLQVLSTLSIGFGYKF